MQAMKGRQKDMELAGTQDGLKSSKINHKRGVGRVIVLNVPQDIIARGKDFGPRNWARWRLRLRWFLQMLEHNLQEAVLVEEAVIIESWVRILRGSLFTHYIKNFTHYITSFTHYIMSMVRICSNSWLPHLKAYWWLFSPAPKWCT